LGCFCEVSASIDAVEQRGKAALPAKGSSSNQASAKARLGRADTTGRSKPHRSNRHEGHAREARLTVYPAQSPKDFGRRTVTAR